MDVRKDKRLPHVIENGAIELNTGLFSLPIYAIKSKQYQCPYCHNKTHVKKGKIRKHHFCHYSQKDECDYYNNTSNENYEKINEGFLHKQSKRDLKNIITKANGRPIEIQRYCATGNKCRGIIPYKLDQMTSKTELIEEYSMVISSLDNENHDKMIRYDLAWIEDGVFKYGFEICNTNSPHEANRPYHCNWFEFDARDIHNIYNNGKFDEHEILELICVRSIVKCDTCINNERICCEIALKEFEKQADFISMQKVEFAAFQAREAAAQAIQAAQAELKESMCRTCEKYIKYKIYPYCYGCLEKRKTEKTAKCSECEKPIMFHPFYKKSL